MSEKLTQQEARAILHDLMSELGVSHGDVLYLAIDMGNLPLPNLPFELSSDAIRAREERLCAFVLEGLLGYLGPEGTLLVPAFTYSCSKPGSMYVHEETPSELGPFPEYIRKHPQAHRSVHPIFSVAGMGRHAHDILHSTGTAAFGAMSVFEKLNDYDCKFVFLGSNIGGTLTYMHHLEQTYGCNHRYNKVFNVTVTQNGQKCPGPWLAYVGFRSIQARPQGHSLEVALKSAGGLRERLYQDHPYQCVDIADINDVGYRMLKDDPCAFMTERVEVALIETESMKQPVAESRAAFSLTHNPEIGSD